MYWSKNPFLSLSPPQSRAHCCFLTTRSVGHDRLNPGVPHSRHESRFSMYAAAGDEYVFSRRRPTKNVVALLAALRHTRHVRRAGGVCVTVRGPRGLIMCVCVRGRGAYLRASKVW